MPLNGQKRDDDLHLFCSSKRWVALRHGISRSCLKGRKKAPAKTQWECSSDRMLDSQLWGIGKFYRNGEYYIPPRILGYSNLGIQDQWNKKNWRTCLEGLHQPRDLGVSWCVSSRLWWTTRLADPEQTSCGSLLQNRAASRFTMDDDMLGEEIIG